MRIASSRWCLASVLLAVIVVLGGCASLLTTRTLPDALPSEWSARRDALQAWTRFESHGRVAIAHAGEGFSGSWRWAQHAQRSRLELNGPLGVGGVRLQFGAGDVEEARARLVLEQQLGFALPIDSLRYWMLGVPDPSQSAEERVSLDAPRLEGLNQAGWTVAFTSYAPVAGADYELPQRIEASREALRVRLVIEGWSGGTR